MKYVFVPEKLVFLLLMKQKTIYFEQHEGGRENDENL